MTIQELKDVVNSIPERYNDCDVFTDVGFNEFAEVKDLARIAEPKINGYKIPKNKFYIGLITE